MDVVVIETRPLGDRSYLVHDGQVALVIDPQRDTDRVEAAAAAAHVRITHVAETHLHNDYLTGGLILARTHGAVYLVNGADAVEFERTPVADGGTVRVGRLTLKAVATPGHTHHHLSYVVTDGQEQAVFSGGSLLYGSVGRDGSGHLRTTQKSSLTPSTPPSAGSPPRPGRTLPSTPPTGSARSVRQGRRRVSMGPPWAEQQGSQPRLHGSGRGPLCAGAHQKPDRLSVLLRAHGAGKPAGPGPRGPRPPRNRSIRPNSAAGWRTANGWWTCATGWRSPAATCRGR